MDQAEERIIEEVRKYDHLYNSSLKDYKDCQMTKITNTQPQPPSGMAVNCNFECSMTASRRSINSADVVCSLDQLEGSQCVELDDGGRLASLTFLSAEDVKRVPSNVN